MTPKEKVEKWLEDKNPIPLGFFGFIEQNHGTKYREISLDELVVKVLDLTKKYSSENTETKNIETPAFKYRSSYDIWRHVIYFQPNYSLLDVMDSIYRNEEKFYGQYCTTIYRRVFRTKSNDNSKYLTNENKDHYDEYNLIFNEWKNINKEENLFETSF
ncbi:MAG: hypothetical protein BV456_01740 [Thermoplasmata archaeon M8B2D]|nr:MAG: hypothetical protein BV456_01740 [Thermoplasmata archaeon M8B2D]